MGRLKHESLREKLQLQVTSFAKNRGQITFLSPPTIMLLKRNVSYQRSALPIKCTVFHKLFLSTKALILIIMGVFP